MEMTSSAVIFIVTSAMISILLIEVFVDASGHVLFIPHPALSHVLAMTRMCKELREHYGYNATMVLAEQFANQVAKKNTGIKIIISDALGKIQHDKFVTSNVQDALEVKQKEINRTKIRKSKLICNRVLEDPKLVQDLSRQKFDIAVIDILTTCLCFSAICYNLSIPFIHYGRSIDIARMRIVVHPSVFPCESLYTDRMSFTQRIANVFYCIQWYIRVDDTTPSDVVGKYAPQKPHLTNDELQAQTQLYLLDFDVLMDYHLPAYPNTVFVGGIDTRPARDVTGDIKTFMDSAADGIVVVSFGSVIDTSTFPETLLIKLMHMFSKLNETKFIFRYGSSSIEVGNVLYMPWIPQNDLLGHPKTRAFVTHCGNGAQFEALYHGVPMLGIPILWDQPYNAVRMHRKGYGLYLDAVKFSKNDLVEALLEVLTNSTYRENIKNASLIFRSRPESPGKRASYWIDHVVKYGGQYLRPAVAEIPYHQFLLMEVGLFFLGCVVVIQFAFFVVFRCLMKRIFLLRYKKDKTD